MKPAARVRRFPRPEDGLRAVMQRAPQAEALAESWIAPARPLLLRLYEQRRRIATITVAAMAISLFVHVMFGANGMIVYRKKRAEYESLQRQIQDVQRENDRYTQQVQGLKSDQKAIEKEAREQLGYAKPGEFVYVAPAPAKPAPPPANHFTKK